MDDQWENSAMLLDINNVMLVEEVAGGWATPMNENGELVENLGEIYVLAITHRDAESAAVNGDTEVTYLALSPRAFEDLILLLGRDILDGMKGEEVEDD